MHTGSGKILLKSIGMSPRVVPLPARPRVLLAYPTVAANSTSPVYRGGSEYDTLVLGITTDFFLKFGPDILCLLLYNRA